MIIATEVLRGLLAWGLWVWLAILIVIALLALFRVSYPAEPASHGGDGKDDPT